MSILILRIAYLDYGVGDFNKNRSSDIGESQCYTYRISYKS